MADQEQAHVDPTDGLTYYGGDSACAHRWEEMPEDDEGRPSDVCVDCGAVKY